MNTEKVSEMKYRVLILKCFILSFSALLVFNFCSCNLLNNIIAELSTTEVPEENLTITAGRGCQSYKYSEKAQIVSDTYISSFDILVNEEDYLWDTLLMGKLEKFAHYEDYLVMIFDGKYYSFDLENYSVPKSEDDLQYDLEEYSEDEFKEKFPQYESFEWRE